MKDVQIPVEADIEMLPELMRVSSDAVDRTIGEDLVVLNYKEVIKNGYIMTYEQFKLAFNMGCIVMASKFILEKSEKMGVDQRDSEI